jgi:spore germination cell wall hydrolase CwlJ-like protein
MMATSLLCLALVVAREAGGEPPNVQRAVTHVVRNRMAHTGKSVCYVTKLRQQFQRARRKPDIALIERVASAWRQADITHGATHFHDPRRKPAWARHMTQTAHLGRLRFYK